MLLSLLFSIVSYSELYRILEHNYIHNLYMCLSGALASVLEFDYGVLLMAFQIRANNTRIEVRSQQKQKRRINRPSATTGRRTH